MILKCRINGKEYPIVQGIPIKEEFNETLDSASIIIPSTEKIDNLMPYDDVYIYEGEFIGYPLNNGTLDAIEEEIPFDISGKNGRYAVLTPKFNDNLLDCYTTYSKATDITESYFELHLIWDDNSKDILDYSLIKENGIFYLLRQDNGNVIGFNKIQLTEVEHYGYEFILNFGNDAPKELYFNNKIKWYAKDLDRGFYKHFLVDEMPYELINIDNGIYKYKINLFSETKKLDKIPLPNLTITPPFDKTNAKTVWDYLNIYIDLYSPEIKVVDKISTETENWVYRKKYRLDYNIKKIFNSVYAPEQSFSTPTLRELLTALMLTKDCIPYVEDDVIKAMDISARNGLFEIPEQLINISGSRSSDNHIDNLKRNYSNALSQEYSAKQIKYMGFRNSSTGLMTLGNMRLEFGFPIYSIDKIHMCYFKKIGVYDGYNNKNKEITFLCKQDITPLVILNSKRNILSEDWTKFENKPLSVEDIAKFKLGTIGYDIGATYISGWGETYTYMKNPIFDGTKSYIQNIYEKLDRLYPLGIYQKGYFRNKFNVEENEKVENIYGVLREPIDYLVSHSDLKGAAKLKGIFFEVEYKALYNGTTTISKDTSRDDIISIDNATSGLTVLEKDGLFQKEKANRFGNEALIITARYDTIEDLQPLGSVYDDDFIIYHREYSIYENYISCVYYATKDYVLKNYFTSVFSKLKPFALASYEESVTRAENKKLYYVLSKDNRYFNYNDSFYNLTNDKLSSALKESTRPKSINENTNTDKINTGIISSGENKYLCDVNTFLNGTSLCMNIKPYDNVSMGVYIEKIAPDLKDTSASETYTGAIQNWYLTADENGFAEKLGFYVAHSENDIISDNVSAKEIDAIYEKLFSMPKANDLTLTNVIGKEYNVNKDNKEIIDMTFQIEPIPEKDVFISPMFFKLNDFVGEYQKNAETYSLNETFEDSTNLKWIYGAMGFGSYYPLIALAVTDVKLNQLKSDLENGNIKINGFIDFDQDGALSGTRIIKYSFTAEELTEITDDYIAIVGTERMIVNPQGLFVDNYLYSTKKTYKLKKKNNPDFFTFAEDMNLFINADVVQPNKLVVYYDNQIISQDKNGNVTEWENITAYPSSISRNIFYGDVLSSENTDVINIGDNIKELKVYEQNLYLVTSTEKIKPYMMYNEVNKIVSSDFSVNDKITVSSDSININLVNLIQDDTNSIQVWFYNGNTNNFVFGVNLNDEDKQKSNLEVYTSLIKTKDERIFGLDNEITGTIYKGADKGQIIERSTK